MAPGLKRRRVTLFAPCNLKRTMRVDGGKSSRPVSRGGDPQTTADAASERSAARDSRRARGETELDMKTVIRTAMASAFALATTGPVAAQGYYPYGTPYPPTDAYRQQQWDYQQQRDQYQDQREAYRADRAQYEAARAAYDRRRADWEAARASYDARYGYGSYIRIYGPAPVWDEARWEDWYAPSTSYYAPSAGYYGRDTAYVSPPPLRCSNNSAVTAGILGAIAGGVLGSNVAGHGERTTGTVLGALVGGGVGAAVGNANDRYRCDAQGAYYSFNDTLPYRVSDNVYRDPRYDYWRNRGCRLAPAPVNDTDYAYVRVCPDSMGRYRITG
jgi:hypothetical protein